MVHPSAPTPQPRQLSGVVVSDAMAKTRIVVVERWKWHPKYKKSYRVRQRYAMHDPEHLTKVGDQVLFEECRPLSKTKRWLLVQKVETRNSSASPTA